MLDDSSSDSSSAASAADSDSDANKVIPENAFKGKTSPFNAPHQLGKDTDLIVLSHHLVAKHYYPRPTVTPGQKFLGPDGKIRAVDKVSRHKQKRHKKVSYKDDDGKIKQLRLHQCVPIHPPNAFLQHKNNFCSRITRSGAAQRRCTTFANTKFTNKDDRNCDCKDNGNGNCNCNDNCTTFANTKFTNEYARTCDCKDNCTTCRSCDDNTAATTNEFDRNNEKD
jgi:hypothetical protein